MLNILRNDDLDGITAFIASGYTEENFWNDIDDDAPKMLQHHPSFISAAAYFGAVKCTVFLIQNGNNLFVPDLILFIFIKAFFISLSTSLSFCSSFWKFRSSTILK